MKKLFLTTAALAAFTWLGAFANAQIPGYFAGSATPYGGGSDNAPGLNIGQTFTVANTNIQIFSLGVYDYQGDGLLASHTVILFSNQTQIASVTVPAGTSATLIKFFRYVALPSPITLSPGTYSVVAYQMNGNKNGHVSDPYGDSGANVNGFVGSFNIKHVQTIFEFTSNGSAYPGTGGFSLGTSGAPSDLASASIIYSDPAPTIAYTDDPMVAQWDSAGGFRNLGHTFTVISGGITVFQLGAFNCTRDTPGGLHDSHSVTLFTNSSPPTALATVTVPAGNVPLGDGFRFAPLDTPITLPAGNYSIIVYGYNTSSGHDVVYHSNAGGFNGGGNVLDAGVNPRQYTTDGSPAYPNDTDQNYACCSFTYTNVIVPIVNPFVTPGSYDFGGVTIGAVAQATLTITNGGGSTLNGTASVAPGAFSIVSGSPYSVAPGGTATVTVQFSPPTGSNYNVTVLFDSGSQICNVPVAGSGLAVPVADFSGTPTVGVPPLTVTFMDTSFGGTSNRFWNFGDGTTTNTTTKTVQHIYTSPGRWTVTLVAENALGVSTNTKPKYIGTTPVVRILPVGDSITFGSSNPSPVPGGYRTLLAALMTNLNYNVVSTGLLNGNSPPGMVVMHEGHPAATIAGVNYCMQGVLNSTDDPDIILLLLGTNDYSYGEGDGATNRLDAMISNLATNRPSAKIIVANVLVRWDATCDLPISNTFNAYIPGIVAAHAALGQQVYFVDLRSAVPSSALTDGLHPNAYGYACMAAKWFNAITNVMGVFGSTNAPVISHLVSQGGLTNVAVTFSKPLSDSAANPANFSLSGGATISAATLDIATKRVVTLTTSPLTPNATYTLIVSNVVDLTDALTPIAAGTTATFKTCGARGVTNNVTESSHYQLAYSLDIPNAPNYSSGVNYTVNNHASLGAFGRVAYYLELQATNGGPLQYIWVSMNPFTTNLAQLGVPTLASGAVFQQPVTNMNVASSVAAIVTGTNLAGGNLEFWPYDYSQNNSLSVANASSGVYDWGDQMNTGGNHGSMRIGNPAASQMLLSFNAWGGTSVAAADLGIGNNTVYHSGDSGPIDNFTDIQPDWTLRSNAASYAVKTLQVFIQPVPVPGTKNLAAVLGHSTTLAAGDLVALAGNPASYPLSVTTVSATSTNGGTVNLSGGIIAYTPAAIGPDRFNYTLSDGNGGTATGYVNVTTTTNSVTGTNSIAGIVQGSPTTLTAYGVPNYYYILQRATNLAASVWVDVQTNQAAPGGAVTGRDFFNDLGGHAPGSAYYRFHWQP